MTRNDFRPCTCCGQWFITGDMQKVRNGKYVAYYCDDCTYMLLSKPTNGGKTNERKEINQEN